MQQIKNIDQEKKDYHEDIGFNLIFNSNCSAALSQVTSLLQRVFALLLVI